MGGLPIPTKMGESLASRMAASLLRAVDKAFDCFELIITAPDQIVAQAIQLARSPHRLTVYKERLL